MNSNSVFIIASMTALLKRLLDNEIVRQFAHAPVGDVMITALPPDRIQLGTEERAQLNLYLYRVTANSTRQSASMLTQRAGSSARLPLALDLHYLLAAYGEKELQADVLLGCAAQLFHENPVVSPATLRSLLATTQNGGSTNPLLETIASSTFIDQLQPVKLIPEFLSIDDISKLWASWQAHARPALTYQVSMVLVGNYDEEHVAQGKTAEAVQ
jgi:hypothetical protein